MKEKPLPKHNLKGAILTCRECGKTPAEQRDGVSERAIGYLCCRCLMNPVNIAADCQSEKYRPRIKQVVAKGATDSGSDGVTAILSENQWGHSHRRRRVAPSALEALPRARGSRAAKRLANRAGA